MKFRINTKLPSLNDYIDACRKNKYAGADFKRETENTILYYIYDSINKGEIKPVSGQCFVHFEWNERTKKRDADNIASAKKFILDALQKTVILPNDGRKYIAGFTDRIIDSTENYVDVVIEEINNGDYTR